MVDLDVTGATLGLTGSHAYLAEAIRLEVKAYRAIFARLTKAGQSWSTHLEIRGITLTVLTGAYLEALINLYLSLKMNNEQFDLIDKASPLEKWVTAPKLFLPEYTFPKSESSYGDLKRLFSRRNQIVHMRPELRRGATLIHKGNSFISSPDNHRATLRWLKLPQTLITHLGRFDKSADFQLFSMMTWAARLSTDERRV